MMVIHKKNIGAAVLLVGAMGVTNNSAITLVNAAVNKSSKEKSFPYGEHKANQYPREWEKNKLRADKMMEKMMRPKPGQLDGPAADILKKVSEGALKKVGQLKFPLLLYTFPESSSLKILRQRALQEKLLMEKLAICDDLVDASSFQSISNTSDPEEFTKFRRKCANWFDEFMDSE